MTHRPLRRLALTALILILSWRQAPAEGAYDINVILPLSGAGAYGGQTHEKGLKLLEAVFNKEGGINGQPVHFVFADDQSSPQVAVQLTSALIAQNVPVIIGSDLSAMCRAMMPLAAQGPVEYCLSPAVAPAKGSYAFSANIGSRDQSAAEVNFARDKGWNRIGVLTSTDASGQNAHNEFTEIIKEPQNKALALVDSEQFNPTDLTVAAQLQKLNAAHPQVLMISVPGAPFGTTLRGLKDAGIDLPVMASSANMVTSQLAEYASYIPKQLYFGGVGYTVAQARDPRSLAAQQPFIAAVKAAGETLDVQIGVPWDPAAIIIDALRHLGTKANARQIHDYIENLHDYPGIMGLYDFRDGSQRGLSGMDTLIVRWNPADNGWLAASKFGGGLK